MRPRIRSISLAEWSNTFVPFGVLLSIALILPEISQNLTLHRLFYTIWVTTIWLTISLCLTVLPTTTDRQRIYADLSWTFAYLTYLTHFYFAVFIHYGGITETFQGQPQPIAAINFFLTIWWTIDILLLWGVRAEPRWLKVERWLIRCFLFLVFVITDSVLFDGVVRYLGITLALCVLSCLFIRWKDSMRS